MKKAYKINGMHCASCEVLVERNFKGIKGIKNVSVNHRTGKAEVECECEPTLNELTGAVKGAGYSVSQWTQKDDVPKQIKPDYSEIGAIFLILVGLYFFFKRFNLIPDIGVTDNMTYGFIFLIGLVAAMSTCIATTGGLLLGVATKYNEAQGNVAGYKKLKPHIYFNIGRIISYTLLGGLLGILGSLFTLSTKVTGIFTVIISIVMVLLGLQLLNIVPAKYSFRLPKSWTSKLYDSSTATGKAAPFLFGSLTFFLPCGFTQALQLYVLTQGSFTVGALTMLAFSLGTLPALLSLGAISSFAKGAFQYYLTKFAGVAVILVGIFSVVNGAVLTGYAIPSFSQSGNQDLAQIVDGKQIVEMTVNGLEYYPSQFTIKKGIPVEWRINGKQAQGCAGVIAVPNLRIAERLSHTEPTIITFTPQQAGRITFSCGMGMAGPGTFIVV